MLSSSFNSLGQTERKRVSASRQVLLISLCLPVILPFYNIRKDIKCTNINAWCLRNELYKLACNWTDYMQNRKEQYSCCFNKDNLSDLGFKFYSTCRHVQISNSNPDLTEADLHFLKQTKKMYQYKKKKKEITQTEKDSLVLTQLGLSQIQKKKKHTPYPYFITN